MLPVPDPFPTADTLHLVATAAPDTVRCVLRKILAAPPVVRLADNHRATVEIVLAEALNNIAEHAYADAPGQVGITLTIGRAGLECDLVDQGLPMPDARLPAGLLPRFDPGELALLPEGGFGWHLIRRLTRDLAYRRSAAGNHLHFVIPPESP